MHFSFAVLTLCLLVPAKPETAAAQTNTNAYQAREIHCHKGGRPKSRFVDQGNRTWVEHTAAGKQWRFRERNRDEWSVYLHDAGRKIQLQLDLHTKKVTMNHNGRRGVVCSVNKVVAKADRSQRPATPNLNNPTPGRAISQRPPPPPARPSRRPPPSAPTNVRPPPPSSPSAPFVEEVKDARLPGVSEAMTRKLVQWVIKESGRLEQPVCWKDSRPNTAGKPLTQCPPDKEKDGALCYPKCKKGYHGVGPVCWQDCPSRFKDTGGHCLKPKSYGRGAGYPWKFGDKLGSLTAARKRCKKKHKKCEKHGAIIYPKCKKGFKPAGCCVCSPKCPSGMTDIGVSCQKKSYGRTAGEALQCRANQVQKGALCYPTCPSGYAHGGPVCWKKCEPGHPVDCGAMCGQSSAQCVGEVSNMVLSSAVVVANVAGAALTGGAANAGMSAAKTAARAGSKIVAKNALKRVVAKAGATISQKLQRRLGARVINYAARKSGRQAGNRLARDYMKMVTYRAGKKIALAQASTVPELREIAAMVDPTGVVDVINAFDKPICKPTPMP